MIDLGPALITAQASVYRAADLVTRAGGGSGGGRSSGGGSSSRGGSSSGGFSSGGFSSGSGGSLGGGSLIAALIFGGVCLFIVVLFIIIAARASKRSRGSGESIGLPNIGPPAAGAGAFTGAMLGDNQQAGVVTNTQSLWDGINAIKAHDPQFNENDFLSDVNRAFFTIQQAWTERKPEISRQVMHDGIWQQHKFQIDQYISQNKQNVMENLAVDNVRIVAADSDAAFDTITVRYFAHCADYDIDLSNDKRKVTRGDKSIQDWAEDWIYQRSSKAVTKPNAGTLSQKCPNCGAPLDLDLAGVCKYCRAPVMSGEFDWVLTRIEQLPSYEWAQSTLPQ